MLRLMADLLKLIWWVVIGLFRSRASLQAEIVALRHQLNVLRRKSPKRLTFNNFDRLIFASLYRIAPRIMNALAIVKPATVIRWHRAGFCLFWRKAANRAMLRLMVDLLKLICGWSSGSSDHEPLFRQRTPWRSCNQRPSFGGIVLVFVCSGDGSRDLTVAGQRSRSKYVN